MINMMYIHDVQDLLIVDYQVYISSIRSPVDGQYGL